MRWDTAGPGVAVHGRGLLALRRERLAFSAHQKQVLLVVRGVFLCLAGWGQWFKIVEVDRSKANPAGPGGQVFTEEVQERARRGGRASVGGSSP